MQQPLAYLNGELVPADQAVLPVYDAGIVQGATVSETLRTFHHELFRLEEHLDRFTNSLATVGFDIGLETEALAGICRDLVAHNTVSLDTENDLGLVIFATAGPYATYSGQPADRFDVGPTLCVHSFPLPFHLWHTMQAEGLHLVTPSVQQLPAACVDPSIKHRSRLHYYLADREATQTAEGARAVLLDQQGRLTETTAAGFLLVSGQQVIAPAIDSVLQSISVEVVAELCQACDLSLVRRDLWPDDVPDADEALVASTPYCLAPVTRFNSRAIGNGKPGPIYDQLVMAWDRLVGLDIRNQIQHGAANHQQPQMNNDPGNHS